MMADEMRKQHVGENVLSKPMLVWNEQRSFRFSESVSRKFEKVMRRNAWTLLMPLERPWASVGKRKS